MNKLKFFITIIVLVVIDQLSKVCIIYFKSNLPVTIINGVLRFNYCENGGIAFGLASGYASIVSVFTLVVLVAIIVATLINFSKISKICSIGIALLTAGGFGNFIDRAFKSYVVDFIDFSELIKFPIFNIADIFVVVGVILIGVSYIINYGREKVEGDNC